MQPKQCRFPSQAETVRYEILLRKEPGKERSHGLLAI